MENYLLVHGAWHGAWCWDNLLPYLSSNGQVHTIHLPWVQHKDVRLGDYVRYIGEEFNNIDGKVTLIGHSFAGMIISEVASRWPQKIAKLIYVNGLIPILKDSLWTISSSFKFQHLTPYLNLDLQTQNVTIYPINLKML